MLIISVPVYEMSNISFPAVTVSSRVPTKETLTFCPRTGGSGTMVNEANLKWSVDFPQFDQISLGAGLREKADPRHTKRERTKKIVKT